ncbi:MAG: cbb3-type cytochrome c oxidase subunit I [Bacteroidia bacterium]|nr:cbb3-type cytochrome c oxidase subunit I [Bacteroidia bacterium]
MILKNIHIGRTFLLVALILLVTGLVFGLMAALNYILPGNLKDSLGFISLRPLHVSSVQFWILLGASGSVFCSLELLSKKKSNQTISLLQLLLWLIAIFGILRSYFIKDFGGREYWEFNPIWALPLAAAWLLFLVNFFMTVKPLKNWPVYVWMWMTGIVFFLFTFTENYLWIFPYFREHFVKDMTIQWKVNGSLVGSWNQIIYGTSFFLMTRISGSDEVTRSKLAFGMYFLGLFNLMFNWGHHIYTLPTAPYVRYFGYGVSMTEWFIFLRLIYTWRQSLTDIQKHYHYFPYRFLMAADLWVFLNIGQALLMSIPAINIYTHGTHVTVAHAMGTTIGINTMILMAACFEFLGNNCGVLNLKRANRQFWIVQLSLVVFWLALNIAGVKKAMWQMSTQQQNFSKMMEGLYPWFGLFILAGLILSISLGSIAFNLVKSYLSCRIRLHKEKIKSISVSHIQIPE